MIRDGAGAWLPITITFAPSVLILIAIVVRAMKDRGAIWKTWGIGLALTFLIWLVIFGRGAVAVFSLPSGTLSNPVATAFMGSIQFSISLVMTLVVTTIGALIATFFFRPAPAGNKGQGV
ncbi:MAG: hypothetical protein FD175_2659 [Beijerinckiaceae bacterium]|nr:MAG: hypothetical protein FD175_2659 [Beijerinckiaceae bacterium]